MQVNKIYTKMTNEQLNDALTRYENDLNNQVNKFSGYTLSQVNLTLIKYNIKVIKFEKRSRYFKKCNNLQGGYYV